MNVQAWANAACTTIRSATNLVNLHHEEKDLKKAITIDGHGQWTDVKAQGACPCDTATGRVGGAAPTRAEMVKEAQKETAALIGKENVLWHYGVRALRTGLPHSTEIVGAGSEGERIFEIKPDTLPAALQKEMKNRDPSKRDKECANMGPLECYYVSAILRPLLHMAGAGITPPAPLANDPMPEGLRFVRISTGGTWAAVTQRNLAVVNRDDFWSWMVFNDRAIGETPEFTRTVIQHELEHAADYEKDLQAFEATHPRPASVPPHQFGQPADEPIVRGWSGDWGKYINDLSVKGLKRPNASTLAMVAALNAPRRLACTALAASASPWSTAPFHWSTAVCTAFARSLNEPGSAVFMSLTIGPRSDNLSVHWRREASCLMSSEHEVGY